MTLPVRQYHNAKSADRSSILSSVSVAIAALTAAIFTLMTDVDRVAEAQSNTVDIRLVSGTDKMESGATFTVSIQIEPNGQETMGVQAFVDFDPDHIRVDSVTLGSASPLTIKLFNAIDNSLGTIDVAAGTLGSGPSATFTLATIVARAKSVDTFTTFRLSKTLPRKTVASILGTEIQRELIGTTVAIGHTDPVNLDIQKTGTPKTVVAGGELTYTIGVTNTGATTATEVTVSDTLPSGMTLESASSTQGNCESVGSKVTCNLGLMAGGSTSSIEIITIPSFEILGDEPKNIANVTSSQIDLKTFNNTASTTIQIPAVSYQGLIILGSLMAIAAFAIRVRARSRGMNWRFHE